MLRFRVMLILLMFAILGVLLVGGCGGSDSKSYPQYKDLTLVLAVQTKAGLPIGDATVLVDGTADPVLTDVQFHPLGAGYPDAWADWLANWTSDAYQAVIHNPGDQANFEIRVQKAGWTDDTTLVTVNDSEPDHIFIRDIMVMDPVKGLQAQAVRPPHRAEVLPAPPGMKFKAPTLPRKIIQGLHPGGN
jgi:hypothetical protein